MTKKKKRKKTSSQLLHFVHFCMSDGEESDRYLDLHVARSSCALCSPCASPGCGQRREIWESPWPRRRPQPERMRTAGSCCSGRRVSPPALCNSQNVHTLSKETDKRRANKQKLYSVEQSSYVEQLLQLQSAAPSAQEGAPPQVVPACSHQATLNKIHPLNSLIKGAIKSYSWSVCR